MGFGIIETARTLRLTMPDGNLSQILRLLEISRLRVTVGLIY